MSHILNQSWSWQTSKVLFHVGWELKTKCISKKVILKVMCHWVFHTIVSISQPSSDSLALHVVYIWEASAYKKKKKTNKLLKCAKKDAIKNVLLIPGECYNIMDADRDTIVELKRAYANCSMSIPPPKKRIF